MGIIGRVAAFVLLLSPVFASASDLQRPLPTWHGLAVHPGRFTCDWNRPVEPPDTSLFGLLKQYAQRRNADQQAAARGYVRSFSFQYKSFTYERNFFQIYRGVILREFADGRMSVGVYKHRVNRGLLMGSAARFTPGISNTYELMLRWNLSH